MKRKIFWIGFALMVFMPLHAAATTPARYAIVIGVNDADNATSVNDPATDDPVTLRYADDDALAIHKLLGQVGVESTLLVDLDKDSDKLHGDIEAKLPTEANLLDAFENIASKIQVANEAGQKTELFIFYSGHGNVEDGEGYVVLRGGKLTRQMLLTQVIAQSPANLNHVIIDACKSYFMVFGKGPGGRRSPYKGGFARESEAVSLENTGFILSSSSARDSHEWERFQAGVFSYEIRSALRGGADIDGDGTITYGEIGAFVSTANDEIANPRFRPQVMVKPPGNLSRALLDWQGENRSLVMDRVATGHVYVEDENGIRILDVHPEAGQTLTVYLPEASHIFVRTSDENSEWSLGLATKTVLSQVEPGAVTVARKGALHMAFEKLFEAPFDSDAHASYEANFEKNAVLQAEVAARDDKLFKLATSGRVAGWTSVGALILGGTMTGLALGERSNNDSGSQADINESNDVIQRYNTAAVVFYGLAGAAGATWLVTKIVSKKKKNAPVTVAPTVEPNAAGLVITGPLRF